MCINVVQEMHRLKECFPEEELLALVFLGLGSSQRELHLSKMYGSRAYCAYALCRKCIVLNDAFQKRNSWPWFSLVSVLRKESCMFLRCMALERIVHTRCAGDASS